VRRLFKQRFDLGMFDPVGEQIYTKIPASVIDSADHSRLALQSARESMVLLKNQGGILPLAKDLTVAVIGPNADVRETLLSNYHGMRCQDGSYNCVQSPLEAVQQMIGSSNVIYAQGTDIFESFFG
jgi:beta-glucosidase-like glycosyl hydrolase